MLFLFCGYFALLQNVGIPSSHIVKIHGLIMTSFIVNE